MARHHALLLVLLLGACSSTSRPPASAEDRPVVTPPSGDAAVSPVAPDASAAVPPELVLDAASDATPAAPALVADGGACVHASDCASGICEGQGCGPEATGICAPAQRACTRDARPYCGCDGKTFRTSGTCPGRRYAAKGACPSGNQRAEGAPCLRNAECASKMCQGIGCANDEPGTCAGPTLTCTDALATWCGCDGKTFGTSDGCPRQRVASRGACR